MYVKSNYNKINALVIKQDKNIIFVSYRKQIPLDVFFCLKHESNDREKCVKSIENMQCSLLGK